MIKFDEQDFLKKYRGSERFISEGKEYYDCFLALLQDDDLLEKIRFANDTLKVPPLKTFISYERSKGNTLFGTSLEDKPNVTLKDKPYIKKGLGACFGYLYKFIYRDYEAQQTWFNDELTDIKTASYFIKK
jgi:hypothetical protein